MEKFNDKDVQEFSDKIFDVVNKLTAGHMVEPENVDKELETRFKKWIENKKLTIHKCI